MVKAKILKMRKLRFQEIASGNMYAIEIIWNFQILLCNTIHLLEMEEWSPWSNCSCGYQTRKRKCLIDDCFTFKKHENLSCIEPNCTGVTSLYFKKILIYHLQVLTIHHKKPRFRLYYSHPGRRYRKHSMM